MDNISKEEQLLIIAAEMYPIGTAFISAATMERCVSERVPYYYCREDHNYISVCDNGGVVYYCNRWAELVENK